MGDQRAAIQVEDVVAASIALADARSLADIFGSDLHRPGNAD
jgi:hypothetical protein